jgi:hypothetical protein
MEASKAQQVLRVSDTGYGEFISKAKNLHEICPDLSKWSHAGLLNEAAVIAGKLFPEEINAIQLAIDDVHRGVIALDIPTSKCFSIDIDAFWGCAVALAITRNLFVPQQDTVNGTPFTVYAASYEKSQKLTAAGLPPIAAEEMLGFHVDGTLHGDHADRSVMGVAIPTYLMLYNVSIAYQKPGSFHWLPFSAWRDMEHFAERFGIGKKYRIRLTPSVYETPTGTMENKFPPTINAPLFFRNPQGVLSLYLNGCVVLDGPDDGLAPSSATLDELITSLMHSSGRVSIPQRARRAIFACNLSGAHARDVFESPFPDAPFGRIFLRSTDSNTHVLSPGSTVI